MSSKESTTEFEKKLALVTGASTGIGFEIAMQFARNGYDLLIAAENEEIHIAANALREHGNIVHVLQVDLSRADGVEELYSRLKQISCPLDAAAINAGVGVGGASFDKTDLSSEVEMINLNIISTVHLAKLLLRDMIKRHDGKILFTSSVAALMPGPYEAVYAATKAFIQSFAEALRVENQDKGITITALLPGPTETEFFHRAGMDDTKVGQQEKDEAALVARQGYEALMEGRDMVVAGSLYNRVQANAAKFMSQSWAAQLHSNLSRPNSPSNR